MQMLSRKGGNGGIKRLCLSEERKKGHKKAGTSSTTRAVTVMGVIKSSIWELLNFKVEVEDDFADKKLPTPEVGIWLRCGLIEYEFLSKPMSENTVLNARTALGEHNSLSLKD